MLYSVDSIADGVARLVGDDDSLLFLPVAELPAGTACGDMLEQTQDGRLLPQPQETAARRAAAAALLERLQKRGGG